MLRLVRLVVVILAVCAATVVNAAPASAHGVDGVDVTNYETRILSIEPETPGIEISPVDLGEQLELRSTLEVDVTVLGYFGEPYLRVGPDGTFENIASPTLELNRDPDAIDDTSGVSDQSETDVPDNDVPNSGDPDPERSDNNLQATDAPDADELPEWVRTGTGNTLRWHDHRAHWMSDTSPAFVQDNPNDFHTVSAFEIGLLVGDDEVTVGGEIVWVPPPPIWPSLVAALILAAGVVAASRTQWWRALFVGASAVLIVSESLHVVGARGATTATLASELASGVYAMSAIVALAIAVVWMLRARDPYDATPMVAIAALITFIAGGLAEVATLNHSQVATNLAPWLARSTVVLALGLGAGLVIAAGLRLRRPQRRRPHASPGPLAPQTPASGS